MAMLDPIRRDRFVQLFPELPASCAEALLLYALGLPYNSKRNGRQIQICKEQLGLNTMFELRCVVLSRLLLN